MFPAFTMLCSEPLKQTEFCLIATTDFSKHKKQKHVQQISSKGFVLYMLLFVNEMY